MKVLWVVQKNLINDTDGQGLVDAIISTGDEVLPVYIVPFSNEIPEVDFDGCVIPYGGTNWINHIFSKGLWTLFFNENFRYSKYVEMYGKNVFNSDAVFMKMGDFSPSRFEDDMLFIRPDKDLKEFAGYVVHKDSFSDWLSKIKSQGYLVNEDTDILVAKASKVDCEWRLFVVDGQVVSGSQYRINYYCKTDPRVPDRVLEYASRMIKIWQPSPVFVMDICEVNGELSILELGDFHSAGWYDSDKAKIIKAVSDYIRRNNQCG